METDLPANPAGVICDVLGIVQRLRLDLDRWRRKVAEPFGNSQCVLLADVVNAPLRRRMHRGKCNGVSDVFYVAVGPTPVRELAGLVDGREIGIIAGTVHFGQSKYGCRQIGSLSSDALDEDLLVVIRQ